MSEAGSISGAIKWTGLSTGTDFGSVVDSLVAIERRTINRQETWKSQWQEKLTAINNLDVRLDSLKLNAQDYNERSKLLSRAAASSDEKVATITNTSTAATGVYQITVGEDIQEKIGSRTFKDTASIGGGAARNSEGHYLDADGQAIGTTDFEDDNVLAYVAERLGVDSVYLDNDGTDDVYRDSATNAILARKGTVNSEPGFYKEGEPAVGLVQLNADGQVVRATSGTDHGRIIPAATVDVADQYFPPLTIEMGGKTLSLAYDHSGLADASSAGLYHENMTMEDLASVINNTVASDPDNMPNLKAELLFDKNRSGERHSRLIITGLEGGQSNHILIQDPTDLRLDRTAVDDPVYTSWVGSQATAQVSADSNYTGHTNKTITVVVTNFNGEGILGTDDVEFSWADTEGNSGKFIVRSSDWDHMNDRLSEDVELLQGVKISLAGKDGVNRMIKNESFSIDCQNPLMQKAADSGLAQTDKWVHQGVSDLTSPVTKQGGVFAYSYAGKEYSLNIPADTSLSSLVERINTDSNNPGVIASILNDGMGTSTSYKLVLSGHRAGQEYGIRILDTTSLDQMPTGPETWDHAREASNSMCRIDGYPNDGVSWIQRQANEVGDVLDGVVVTLQGTGSTTITVQNNVTEMANKIKQLVESVNFCKSEIKKYTKFGKGKLVSKWDEKTQQFYRETEGGEASGVMIGNYGFQIAQSTIDRLMTKQIFTREEYIKAIDPDLKEEGSLPIRVADEQRDGPSQEGLYNEYLEKNGLIYTRLSDIGIASNPDAEGQFIIEESKLTEALTKNPEAVIKLFTFQPDETIPRNKPFADEDDRPMFGGFAVMMGYAMSDLTRSSDVIDENTGEVVTPAKGITKVLAQNYTDIIKGIDEKITREEKRISMVRSRLEEKFSRLETLLASLENQSTSIQAQVDKLNNNSGS